MHKKKYLHFIIYSYNKLVEKEVLQILVLEEKTMQFCQRLKIQELDSQNKSVDELFSQTKNDVSVTLDLSKLYL